MQTLQDGLDITLSSPDGKRAYDKWLGHFEALNDKVAQRRYAQCRARLNRFLGKVAEADYKAWIPIGAISQGTNALYIKCQGRKVAIARFRKNDLDFTIGFTRFDKGKNPANESAILESEAIPYRATLEKLRTLPTSPDFQSGVAKHPEWALEAWLAAKLDSNRTPKGGTVFAQMAPQKYTKMLLQVSSPFSASTTELNGVRVAPKANGHSDILIRRGRGRTSRLGILELKARTEKKNISKSLCQAFAYAYSYYHTFRNLPQASPAKANVLSVLGYSDPWWSQNGPPLEAIAVVPQGFERLVIEEARTRSLFESKAVKSGHIKLLLWTYEAMENGDYSFAAIQEVQP